MVRPIGDVFSPPTHPVRSPNRASAYDTLYSPPPTQTSSDGANSIRPCAGGERRIMHSPSETKSNLHASAGFRFNPIAWLAPEFPTRTANLVSVITAETEFFYLALHAKRRVPFSLRTLLDTLILRAGVAEVADALDSKSSDRKVVEIQVLSPVLEFAMLFAPRFF